MCALSLKLISQIAKALARVLSNIYFRGEPTTPIKTCERLFRDVLAADPLIYFEDGKM